MIEPAIDKKIDIEELESHRFWLLGTIARKIRRIIHREIRIAAEPIIKNQEKINQQLIDLSESNQEKLKEFEIPKIDYMKFENKFRGSEKEIKERQKFYIDFFRDKQKFILDVGCGRGEFLELCEQAGIFAIGVDVNKGAVKMTQEKGLNAICGDVNTFLRENPNETISGIFSAQTVEHMKLNYLMDFLKLAYEKLEKHGIIILETLNITNKQGLNNYFLDITHQTPLPPETLKFLMEEVGFKAVKIKMINYDIDYFVYGLKE